MPNLIEIPLDFKESIPPKSYQEWVELNHSCDFGVSIINKKLKIKEIEISNTCELRLDDGILRGIDNGEFGGRLIFISDDTSKQELEVTAGNIKFIFPFKDKIYYIESFSHLTFSYGALHELNRKENIFSTKKIIDFIDAPYAFTIYNDKLIIITSQNFYIIKGLRKYLVLKKTFWSGLYPNSVAIINDENVFIGIRGGIVKVNLTTKSFKFYKNARKNPKYFFLNEILSAKSISS